MTSKPDSPYFPRFDWLRFILACTVMLSHFGALPWWPQAGNFSVQVFFALSGWLIGNILLDLDRADLPRFYFNRALRIWAPYYIALGFLLCASLLREPVTAKWLEFVAYKATFVWNLFGTQQLESFRAAMPLRGTGNHFWSVNAEEQFYMLAPALLVLASPRLGRHVLTWAALAVATWVLDVYAAIVLGVLAAVLRGRFGEFQSRPAVRAVLACGIAASLALLLSGVTYRMVAPPCAVCIVLLLAVAGRRHPIGAFAGGLSYPLYLNHWIGSFIATVLMIPIHMRDTWLQICVAAVISIGLGGALYWWVDRRILAQRSALFTPPRGRLAMITSYGLVTVGIGFGLVMTRGHSIGSAGRSDAAPAAVVSRAQNAPSPSTPD